jgi:hypothetical protein
MQGGANGPENCQAADRIAGLSGIKTTLVVISPQDKPEVVRVKIKELRDELEHRSSNHNLGEEC